MGDVERSDSQYWREVEEVFALAVEAPAEARDGIVESRCAGRPPMRADVEALLASHETAGDFIKPRTVVTGTDEPLPPDDRLIGARIGPFRLVERIGEGGMGAVYRGERVEGDFTQVVAVKLIGSRLHNADLLRRFKSEQQILASLQHPNIVTLLDGGVTDSGQPYIAMELIQGTPITAYCASGRLPLVQRLQVFLQVCAAVGFAHRRLVVHRDIKPGNVFVTPDGVVKVLDFGTAKLLERQGASAEATSALLGPLTPDYASPEQMKGLPISTTCDIYSMGVMLYELLASRKPYHTVGRATEAVLSMIIHAEPPRPSAAPPDGLPYDPRVLKGDLDAIILKAMAKDPDRRYASADDLAADLQRHLDHRPVLARPDGVVYSVGRFARRHRVAAAAASVATLSILVGLGTALWQARAARIERDRATAEMLTAQKAMQFLGGVFENANPVLAGGKTVTARDLLDQGSASIERELEGQPAAQATLLMVMARAYDRLGQTPKSLELAERALKLRDVPGGAKPADLADSLHQVGRQNRRLGRNAEAIPNLQRAVSLYESAVGKESRPVGAVLRDLALALRAGSRGAEAKPLFRRAIAIMESEAPDSAALGLLWNNLGNLLIAEGDGSGATAAFETAISVYSRSHEPDRWGIAMPLLSFGDALRQAEEFDRARPLFERALLVDNQTFGEENENSAYTLGRLGELALAEGDLKRSRGLLERSLSMWMKSNAQSPGITDVRGFIGRLLVAEGKPREALPHLLEVAARREASNGPAHPDVARALVDLALAQRAAEGPGAAEQTLAKALAIQRKALKAPHPALVATLNALGEAMVAQRRADEARPLIEESVRIARATLPERHSERLKAEGLLGRLSSS